MSSKQIEESQENREGKAIGQANEDQNIPVGVSGSHRPKHHPEDISIPNQEKSSATNQRNAEGKDAGGE
ncbi:MAG: hypothetical protein EOO14_10850 [Chitinophagaceae bacterium]|nr:MAG: hypothetical protein EOO14_10850 [Chitinophagaceae bacterium]